MLSKRVFLNCDQVPDKAEMATEGEETPPHFQLGGCCDYSVGWSLKVCRQTHPFCGSNWLTDWRDPKKKKEKEWGDKLSFVRVVGRFCLKLDSCSCTSCSHPLLCHQTLLPHMLAGHMPVELVNVTCMQRSAADWEEATAASFWLE